MRKEELAAKLNGMEYSQEIPEDLIDLAMENSLVIVHGYADDSIKFRGAIYDAGGADHGGVIQFDKEGILPRWDTIDKDEELARAYFNRVDNTNASEIIVKQEEDCYWCYETDIPYACFNMVEGGVVCCRGIIFNKDDMQGF